jgi:putative heme-binding domain-containing protein
MHGSRSRHRAAAIALALASIAFTPLGIALGQNDQELIPHAQDRPPNPPKSPAEALAAMTVPEGFVVELVASEPDLVNPVSMTFDEKGRIWVTESLEYPRREPGPGRDRVKVLEDRDGDGTAETVTIFAEGMNIPSGIAIGHGGVWVANSPDILFIPNADGDLAPDGPPEVVATGFGRDDTHELPNSLTWGSDGWLYGWNGVFNPSEVTSSNGKTYEFTCAIWRIHPRTREFQVWCEGTSNPWGIAINDDGEFFASACVIDHLWHLVEGAYYIRQGGPYPPFTYPHGSIVDHKHQKAAYCGITWFDSDAYPEQYRRKLYMGNIHGNCINVDELERDGSTYKGKPCPDFLSANDAWFMPVSQKTGPDGCLYILDWYDRYHCYQDANRDPEGIDRLKGRLYRVRYQNSPRARIDLASEPSDRLIELLGAANDFIRATARRLLIERGPNKASGAAGSESYVAPPRLAQVVFDANASRTHRLEALWTLTAVDGFMQRALDPKLYGRILQHEDPTFRAWGQRAISHFPREIQHELVRELGDVFQRWRDTERHPIVVRAMMGGAALHADDVPLDLRASTPRLALKLASRAPADPLVAHLCWRMMGPSLEDPRAVADLAESIASATLDVNGELGFLWPRIAERIFAGDRVDSAQSARLIEAVIERLGRDSPHRRPTLDALTRSIREGRLRDKRLEALREVLHDEVHPKITDPSDPHHIDFIELAGAWGHPEALDRLRDSLDDANAHPAARTEALEILVSHQDSGILDKAAQVIAHEAAPRDLREDFLDALGEHEAPRVADVILAIYTRLDDELQFRAVELLTRRPAWSKALLAWVLERKIAPAELNVNQVRRLQRSRDPEIVKAVRQLWGTIREGRNEKRELVVSQMRHFLARTPADPFAGQVVYQKLCGQCHKIYGEGEEVGPDITLNGRNDFDQLISNVFDPNLVIGPVYQATNVATQDGRVLTGLLVEDSPERVVLKLQGGKLETISRDDVEEIATSSISLMPEDIENQLTPQEIADLFAYLALDKPPGDPAARRLPGAPEIRPRPAGGSTP